MYISLGYNFTSPRIICFKTFSHYLFGSGIFLSLILFLFSRHLESFARWWTNHVELMSIVPSRKENGTLKSFMLYSMSILRRYKPTDKCAPQIKNTGKLTVIGWMVLGNKRLKCQDFENKLWLVSTELLVPNDTVTFKFHSFWKLISMTFNTYISD